MTPTVGVIGAGTMGRGVSHVFAAAEYPVVLVDIDAGVLAAARDQIATDAKMRRLVDGSSGTVGPAPDEVLDRIRTSTDLGDLAIAGYVVENITEKWSSKSELYRALNRTCVPNCVMAVNTSAIPITRLAGLTDRPEMVVGNHFMNPAHLMPMVEVVRGLHTSDSTVDTACELLAGVGKECVIVNDSPGFVTNRVAMLAVNEAAYLLAEGVSGAVDIDRLFRRCLGHRMGPLETADLIGLDTVLSSLEVLLGEFNDPKFRPCPLLRRYVQAGWLGRKTGRGFHRYDG